MGEAAFGGADEVAGGRLAGPHFGEDFFGGNTPVHQPEALGFAVLVFDVGEEVAQGLVVDGVAWHDLIGEGEPLGGEDESDDDLDAVGAFVAAVTEAAFITFGKVGGAFKVGASEIVEEDFVVGVEEVAPTISEVSEEGVLVGKQEIVAAVEGVFGGEGGIAV